MAGIAFVTQSHDKLIVGFGGETYKHVRRFIIWHVNVITVSVNTNINVHSNTSTHNP